MRHPMRWMAMFMTAFTATVLGGCGSSRSATPTPNPVAPSVGGTYTTVVTLTTDGCGGTTVMSVPTRVEHSPGAATFRVTHAAATWDGSIGAQGAFTTMPAIVTDGTGVRSTLRLAGRFTPTGFEADVEVDREPPTPPCTYVVHWSGTKTGAPNVL